MASENIDLASILQLAVLSQRDDDGLTLVNETLPGWWPDALGTLNTNRTIRIHSAAFQDFVDAATHDGSLQRDVDVPSMLLEFSAPHNSSRTLIETTAVRHQGQRLFLLRDLNNSETWLSPTLQAARSQMLQTAKDNRKHEEERQRLANHLDTARRLEAEKTEMMAHLSHEIRTPLATILGLVNAAQDKSTNSRQDDLEIIASAANEMLALGQCVLELSKLQAGKMELKRDAFSLSAFLRDLCRQWKVLAEDYGNTFELHQADNLPEFVNGDSVRLKQVLTNLLSNAMKFTERGHVSLKVRRSDRSSYLWLEVEDTGVGMMESDLKQIFQPYHQTSGRQQDQGAGLGLAIAQQLVRFMRGEIQVESQPGQGSRFYFDAHLPAVQELASAPTPTDAIFTRQSNRALEGLRLLIAEDHELNRSILVDMLTDAGAEVIEAEDGKKALEELHRGSFQALILDFQMPEVSGPEVIATVRSQQDAHRKIPILLLTAHQFDVTQAKALGANDCLSKPVESVTLVSSILSMLNSQTTTDDVAR